MTKRSIIYGFLTGLLAFIILSGIILYFSIQQINNLMANTNKSTERNKFIGVITKTELANIESIENNEIQRLNWTSENPIFINFWATWCVPCVKELESINKLYKAEKDNVDFYLITDESREVVEAFLLEKDWEFPVYLSHDTTGLLIGSVLPRSYVVKNRILYLSHTGKENWNDSLVISFINGLVEEPKTVNN